MLLHSFIFFVLSAIAVSATGLDPDTILKVRSKMLAIIGHSWEYGTATEALLELEDAEVSVYGHIPFPPCHTLSASNPVVTIAQYALSTKTPGTLPIMDGDGAVGDPASLGVAVLIAGKTLKDASYAEAAAEQLEYLLQVAPRAPNGAISQRASEVQLWADYVYMAPPFIAYYGGLTNNITLLLEGKNQVGYYRDILRDPTTNLWHHILMGSWSEPSLWGTGVGWAAAGGTRVLQTMARSHQALQMTGDMWDLAGWMTELLTAVWSYQDMNTGAIRDHVNNSTDFLDSSSTALCASATYRLAVLTGNTALIWNADQAFNYIGTQIASDGTLQNVVDPFVWDQRGTQSPEGQGFVLLLQAAWRDYTNWKRTGLPGMLFTLY